MVAEIPAVGGCASRSAEGHPGVNAFLAKAAGGIGIEELVLQDVREQREAGRAIRKAQREQRRRLVDRAVKMMKDAAADRFFSGVVGALSGIAAEVLGVAVQNRWTKVVCQSTKFLGGALTRHFLFDVPAARKEGDAKLLHEAAQAASDAAQGTGEWLATARDLERRMVERMDQLTRAEHEGRMSVLTRIGQ